MKTTDYAPVSGFNTEAMRSWYVKQGHIDGGVFDSLLEGVERVRALRIPGLEWRVTQQAATLFPKIPKRAHLAASAAGLGIDFVGPKDFYERAIARGLLSPHMLNVTSFYEVPKAARKLKIGELMVELGMLSVLDLQSALGSQVMIRGILGATPRLAYLITVSMGRVSIPDYLQALSIHFGIEYRTLDECFARIDELELAELTS